MSQGRVAALKKIFSRVPTGASIGASLSVNSLSKLSDQFSLLSSHSKRGETIQKFTFWICFLVSAWLLADLMALLAERFLPSPPISLLSSRARLGKQSQAFDYDIIASRNLFSSKAAPKNGNEIDLDAEPVATRLPLQLVGTVIFKNPTRSMAAVQDTSMNKLYPVRPGDEIIDIVQIMSVEDRRVIFINIDTRRKEFIELPDDTGSIISRVNVVHPQSTAPTAEKRVSFTHAELDTYMGNLGKILTQALAKPEERGGQMIGFRLTQIQPGSFYEKAGLKNQDIIKAVNGEKITDPAKAMSLLGDIKNMSELELTIERNGKDTPLNYDFR